MNEGVNQSTNQLAPKQEILTMEFKHNLFVSKQSHGSEMSLHFPIIWISLNIY